ncbi:MAG: S-methyl-5-thioribose-1-phosphate isomerase [Candidatus Methanomethylicaceae archaeon]
MKVKGKHYRTIWLAENDNRIVEIIDQRYLPFEFVIEKITTVEQMAIAIKDMHLRGAGLIGAAAGYGMYLAALQAPRHSKEAFEESIRRAGELLRSTRPTAVNLSWAVERQIKAIGNAGENIEDRIQAAYETAEAIANEDAEFCRRIGEHGVSIIQEISQKKNGATVNVLTHCNAGWLAFVDYGTATAPIYAAHDAGIPVHVWVDETRPRNQGSRLTAWELAEHGVPHTVIVDNVGGHLMQHGMVDMVITGADRVTRTGDVANKIGTYLKALAARDNQIPFYVAFPSSTIDWTMYDGIKEIPVEERNSEEVALVEGWLDNEIRSVQVMPSMSKAANYGFDVTPSRLITGLITERGICQASEAGLLGLYPEKGNS